MSTESVATEAAAESVDIEEIIRELDAGYDLPEAALRKCQRHPELVTPRLIRAIEEATERVRRGEEPEGRTYWLALYLLWEFKAAEAMPAILAAISLPGEGPFDLFSDGVTEDLAPILAQFLGDKHEFLDSLIADDKLNEYVRWGVAQSYCYLVRDGRMAREEAVELLRRHLRRAIDQNEDNIAGYMVITLCDLNPQEAKAEILEAFDSELIEQFLINRQFVEEVLAGGSEFSARELAKLKPTTLDDVVELMRKWHGFRGPEEEAISPLFGLPNDVDVLDEADERDQDDWLPPPSSPDTIRNDFEHVGRNDPCPCGSGKKYKKCCLRQQPR